MRIICFLLLFVLLSVGCTKQPEKHEPVIEFMCKDASKDILTPEEIEYWDSMNADGGFILIRGAERNLDTIVNHLHIVFTTKP